MAGTGDFLPSRGDSSSADESGFAVAIEGSGSRSPSPYDSHDESNLAEESHRGDFFDLEASEYDESSRSDSDWAFHDSFPQFSRLPVELRRHVWEAFCPDLAQPARVYRFILVKPSVRSPYQVWEHAEIDEQTEPTRSLMAVHRETRDLALAAFPDTLSIRKGTRQVHFNKDTDVVMLNIDRSFYPANLNRALPHHVFVPQFSEKIKHLAIQAVDFAQCFKYGLDEESQIWVSLENLYFVLDDEDCRGRDLWWSASKSVNRYALQTHEEEIGLRYHIDMVYCWPDLRDNRAFANAEIPLAGLLETMAEVSDRHGSVSDNSLPKSVTEKAIGVWPMITFTGDRSIRRLRDFTEMDEAQGYHDSEDELTERSQSEPDEYESDGIDDGDIDEDASASSDEDDLAVLPMSDDLLSNEGGFSPVPLGRYAPARFSSPEPESEAAQDVESSNDDMPTRQTGVKRKRHLVMEDSSDDDAPFRQAAIKRKRQTVMSSSPDDVEKHSSDDEMIIRGTAIANYGSLAGELLDVDAELDSEDDSEYDGVPSASRSSHLGLKIRNGTISSSEDDRMYQEVHGVHDSRGSRGDEEFQDDDQGSDTGSPASDEEILPVDTPIEDLGEESAYDDSYGNFD